MKKIIPIIALFLCGAAFANDNDHRQHVYDKSHQGLSDSDTTLEIYAKLLTTYRCPTQAELDASVWPAQHDNEKDNCDEIRDKLFDGLALTSQVRDNFADIQKTIDTIDLDVLRNMLNQPHSSAGSVQSMTKSLQMAQRTVGRITRLGIVMTDGRTQRLMALIHYMAGAWGAADRMIWHRTDASDEESNE